MKLISKYLPTVLVSLVVALGAIGFARRYPFLPWVSR